jgi:antitoxin component of RelBE/YafQ-DinJ toxin-antitoxin module
MSAKGNKKKAGSTKYLVAAKVNGDLKQRIERFAEENDLPMSEAIRTLLAFAVTEAEDPRTRVLYAAFCNLNVKFYGMMREGLRQSVQAINGYLLDSLNSADLPGIPRS